VGAAARGPLTRGLRLQVVCTPSGGARSVRVELPERWHELPDAQLLRAIHAGQREQGAA